MNIQNLKDSLGLVKAFEKILLEAESEICDAAINVQDKDNFGQYAQGFRYTLTNQKQMSLYAYFGAIYSYKKQPAGIFAEIDRFSNQKEFDRVFNHFKLFTNFPKIAVCSFRIFPDISSKTASGRNSLKYSCSSLLISNSGDSLICSTTHP